MTKIRYIPEIHSYRVLLMLTKVRYIPEIHRYRVLFADGGHGWCSERGMEELFSDKNWRIAKENPEQWFYI